MPLVAIAAIGSRAHGERMLIRLLAVAAVAIAAPQIVTPRAAAADPSATPHQRTAAAELEGALPRGWSVLLGQGELVVRHDRAVYAVAPDAHAVGPLVDLELRVRVEPRWSAAKLASARATNARRTAGNAIKVPTCGLDELSVFVEPQTYAALAQSVEPPQAMIEARQVAHLVQQRCVVE
jgi:hypothetical protein